MTALALKEIGLGVAEQKAVQQRARKEGKSVAEYLRSLVKRDLDDVRRVSQILEPIAQDVARQGLTEEDVAGIVKRARRMHGSKKRRGRR